MNVCEINGASGQVTSRNMTDVELREYEARQAKINKIRERERARQDLEASARAKLAALGLSEAEVAALLGA